jgi:hypothetical protein
MGAGWDEVVDAPSPLVIVGRAYGRRATLEIAGETLVWRAQRGAANLSENIATTIHDVRGAAWIDMRVSRGGLALAALGGIWAASENPLHGAIAIAAGAALLAWRAVAPRRYLVLDVGDRRLVLAATGDAAAAARALAGRIQKALASGEGPLSTPTLP